MLVFTSHFQRQMIILISVECGFVGGMDILKEGVPLALAMISKHGDFSTYKNFSSLI